MGIVVARPGPAWLGAAWHGWARHGMAGQGCFAFNEMDLTRWHARRPGCEGVLGGSKRIALDTKGVDRMVAAVKRRMQPVKALIEGDCFFWSTPERREQIENEVLAINIFRKEIGQSELTPEERFGYYSTGLSAYMVEAVVRASGERCVRKMSDNTFWIWYAGDEVVQYTEDRASFLARLEAIRKDRKRMEDEQQRMNRARSKKQRKSEAEAGA
ncbi:MAG: hypothetical protein AB7G28_13175 [Pirellulales bacterium]